MICPYCRSADVVRADPERDAGYCKNCKKFFNRGEYDWSRYLYTNKSE